MTGDRSPADIDITQKAAIQEGDVADACSQLPSKAVYATADVSSSSSQSNSNSATLMSATGEVVTPHSLSIAAVHPDSTNVSRNHLLDSSLNFAARQQQPEIVANNMAPFGFAENVMNNVNQDMQTFAAQVGDQDTLQSVLGMTGLDGSRGGPMACLWDDCPPFDPFAHFGQQCLDDACGLPPMAKGQGVDLAGLDAGSAVDATTLTCDPACAQEHTHLFPCEPSCSQEHAHIHPMHLHSYSQNHSSSAHNVQLDSATAVLKHLLQQHLGVDLTQGLLNVASQQLGDKPLQTTGFIFSDGQLQSQDISQRTGTTAEATLASRQRTTERRNSGVSVKKPKSLKAPPRGPSDIQLAEKQTHVCRWHNCLKAFESVEDLTEHLSEVHVGKGKTEYECLWVGCEICDQSHNGADVGEPLKGRKFTTRQKVMRHMQAHTGYRPFVCPICGAAVSEQATLLAHIRRHSEDRPFACDADGCDKTFASAASLAVHKRTHDGQKEHVCPHCDKGFLEVSNMKKHIRTHTGEKPFKCKQPGCTKKFSRPDQLKRHAQIHDRGKNSNAAAQLVASGTDESP
ncbi:hypothetical protein QFC19_001598 [Naganishia cerealis]|uniref:Uncharacterized protein n=1 Tax=Naganishia cerealis TaxID=610337 RepID=A0ACC2WHE5_9TREE|nr:hypothetical protein QFC19_001598 [Naganishia cerealis]